MTEWISAKDSLPIDSPQDDKFNGCWYEEEFDVLINGEKTTANFWCCWEVTLIQDDEETFIHEFDEEGVTHWMPKTTS